MGTAQRIEGRSQGRCLDRETVLVTKNCVWSKHGTYFQRHNLHGAIAKEAVQIVKEGKECLSFPPSRFQMSHRATICICG